MTKVLGVKKANEFIRKLKDAVQYLEKNERGYFEITHFRSDESELQGEKLLLKKKTFKDQRWHSFYFDFIEFQDCVFKKIKWDNHTIGGCNFENCQFIDCRFEDCSCHETDFINCVFTSTRIERSIFGDCSFLKNTFTDCHEIYDTYFGGCYYEENIVESCQISFCRFESLIESDEANHFIFSNSGITGTAFTSFNLDKTIFKSCVHSRNIFSSTSISKKTFQLNNKCEDSEYSLIDLHSLAKSDIIHLSILDSLFGIKEYDIKTYAIGMTQNIKLQSVFISYSFSDREFANRLNDSLKRKGVFTFLWEKNAPGGKRLKSIMSDNINFYDRVLFIASENSIKSEACQYELTNARVKQDKLWKTIFIPIHIDDYLFSLQKDEIRPREKREEYWENIKDLREVNSLDFKKFKVPSDFNEEEFERLVYKLIEALK
jgi:uncharacterized protein YjbI with pentapeptide repeats